MLEDVESEKLKLEMAQKAAKAAEAAMLKANQTATKWKNMAAEQKKKAALEIAAAEKKAEERRLQLKRESEEVARKLALSLKK